MSDLLTAFMRDVAGNVDYWTDYALGGLTDLESSEAKYSPRADAFRFVADLIAEADDPVGAVAAICAVVRDCVDGAVHSTLVTLDNGTAMAETGTIQVVDAVTGESLIGDGAYHELLPDYVDA